MIEGLSREQLRFYALHQLTPGDPDLYIVRVLRLRGALELPRLTAAVAALIERHEALRAIVPVVDGEPRLALRATLAPPLRCVAAAELPALLERERRADPPFELERGPLFSLVAVALAADHHVLVLRFHHLICDGASVRRFVEELWMHYEGRAPAGGPAASFRDFAAWEATAAEDRDVRAFWAARLAGAPQLDVAAALSPGRPRPPVHTREAATLQLELPPALVTALRAFCRGARVTPYAVLAAVLARALAPHARDLVLVTPLAARGRRELQTTLGALVQWIALRPRLSADQSFTALVAELRGELAAAYDHATSYEVLLAAAGPAPRDPARNPRFQITLNYTAEREVPAPAGLEVSWDPVESVRTPYDLALRFEEQGERCRLGLTYYRGAIADDDAARFARRYLALAAQLLAHPDERLEGAGAGAEESGASARERSVPAPSTPSSAPASAPLRRLVIASTFTAEPLRPALEFWLAELGLPYQPVFAPAGQLLQQLVDPRGALADNALGANALLVRFDDWKDPAAGVAELVDLLGAHAERSPAPTFVILCPPRPAHRHGEGAAAWQRLGDAVAALADDERASHPLAASRLHVLRWEAILTRYPVTALDDAAGDAYAQAPYSADFCIALGTALARALCAVAVPPPKVLALDCDQTLWRGVVGEDGPGGLVVEEGHRALQELALERRAAGALLCLASKNEEADVWAAFAAAPGMLLGREHIAAHRIDWRPKSQNLQELADQLGLGADSFLFLDDSPAECAEVRARCPAVLAVELPAAPAARRHFFDHLWPLDARKRTRADRERAAMVAVEAERQRRRAAAPDLAHFLASLEVKVSFAPLSAASLARAAQLTQRTNQFNTTTIRRSEAELLAVAGDKLVIDVADRFGDYGTVGLLVTRVAAEALEVESWLLSCRALGRGVEQEILVELGRRAAAAGRARVDIAFTPSAKNRPAAQLLDAVAAAHHRDGRYAIPVAVALAAAELPPPAAPEDAREDGAAPPSAPPLVAPALWRTIATELDTVAKIAAAMARPRTARTALVPPRSAGERAVAAAWCAALHLRELGVDDDYFAVGGDSIRSLAVVAELRRAGLPVSSLELHAHPTVAKLAAYLEARGAPAAATDATSATSATDAPDEADRPDADASAFPLSAAQAAFVEIYARENLRDGAPPSGVFQIRDRFAISLRDGAAREQDDALDDVLAALRRALLDLLRCTAPLRSQLLRGRDGRLWQRSREVALGEVLPLVTPDQLDQPGPPFDPERGDAPLLRAVAARTGPRQLELAIEAHHGFCDGWSLHLAYNRLFALAGAYLAGQEARAAALRAELTASGDGFRQLAALEPSAALAGAASRPAALPPPLTGAADRLHARLTPAELARLHDRARAASVSLKAAVLAAWLRARPLTPAQRVAVVTNRRRAELARPLEIFGLCWSFAPLAATSSVGELHRALLDAEARPVAPLEEIFGAATASAFNFVHFHHARWRDGTPQLHVEPRPPRHRFPFPLDLTARVVEPGSASAPASARAPERGAALELELTWNESSGLDRRAAAALLEAVVAALRDEPGGAQAGAQT